MRVLVLLGAPGAGKGTQAHVLARHLGLPRVATGDLFRAAVRDGTPLGVDARAYMERGALVPDEVTVGMLLERLAAPDAARGAILDGFPRTRSQAEALDRALDERGAGVEAALLVDVPADELLQRLSGRWLCEAAGPHLPRDGLPAAGAPASATSAARGSSSATTTGPRWCGPASSSSSGALEDVVDHYRAAGLLQTVDGRRPIAAVIERPARLHRARARTGGRTRDHPQVGGRDRHDAARRPRRGRGPRPRARRRSARASRRRTSTRSPRRTSAKSGATPSFKGYHGYPVVDLHLDRPRGRPRDPGPTARSATARSSRSTPGRSSTAGTATPPGPSSSATCPQAVRDLVEATRLRPRGGRRGGPCPATGSGTSRPPSRTSPCRAATASSGPYVGHGIGTAMHEEPQVPNYRTKTRGIELAPGHLPGDRADVHARLRPTWRRWPTAGRSSPATDRSPPTGRTPSPSPRTGPWS